MSRDSFPKASKSRASEVGELVHSDLGGPMEVATPRGNRYYMVLVDDYSRYSVVYLLQHKSDAEVKIREYCNMMKNQFGRFPKCIRSDGGGEYSGSALKTFFADNGIVHQMSAPYSPQQNGVAERKNRHLKEMMRCMLAWRRSSGARRSTQQTICRIAARRHQSWVRRTSCGTGRSHRTAI
ncbi:hypothetical protein RP20_CCG008961 [Aedes albopictus]|nr:hypothetical protein RP20_CCG008961 [Aedes albopictus]